MWTIYKKVTKLHKSGRYMVESHEPVAGPYADLDTARTWLRVSASLDPQDRLLISDSKPRARRIS